MFGTNFFPHDPKAVVPAFNQLFSFAGIYSIAFSAASPHTL